MTDPVEEGKAFAAMLGKGPAPGEEPPQDRDRDHEPEQAEDGLITALRQQGKPWAQQFAEMLHPPEKEES